MTTFASDHKKIYMMRCNDLKDFNKKIKNEQILLCKIC